MNISSPRKRVLINTGVALCVIALQVTGCGEVRYRDGVMASDPVKRIVIHGDVGVIELVPGTTAKVDFAVRAPEGVSSVQHSETDGVLQLIARCHTPILCAVDVEVQVPPGVAVEIDLGFGEVWATGVPDLDISVGQGEVDVDTTGRVTVQIGQGDARVVTTGSEQIRVAVGKGDIDVRANPIRWNLGITAENTIDTGIEHDPNARRAMELVAPAGTVRIRPTQLSKDSGNP
jgi:hypothetical protein